MDSYLFDIYYDPKHPAAYGTVDKLYSASRNDGKNYTRESIENWLNKQDTYTLYRPQRRNFPTRKTVAFGIDDVHQTDLGDMSKHARANDGVRFILVVIDVVSKYLWVRPLKDKSNISVVEAFKDIYEKAPSRVPRKLGSDQGKEYTGTVIQRLFKELKIEHYVLYNRQKAAVAERVLRTIKAKLHKYMDSSGSERYVDKLQDFVGAYNAAKHRSIGIAPRDVDSGNVIRILRRLYGDRATRLRNTKASVLSAKYKLGDNVRISKFRHPFEKAYEQSYTDEIFTIVKILQTTPVTYKLRDYDNEDIKGSFYEKELVKVVVGKNKSYRIDYVLKTKGRGRKKRWLIKYRGYKNPEWTSVKPASIGVKR